MQIIHFSSINRRRCALILWMYLFLTQSDGKFWPCVSQVSARHLTVYTCTGTAHAGKTTLLNLERPSAQLTERARNKGSDGEGWGRCKVINYLWVKSNKRQEFQMGGGRDSHGPHSLPRHIVAILCRKNKKAEKWKWESCLWGLCSAIQMCLQLHSIFLFFPPLCCIFMRLL